MWLSLSSNALSYVLFMSEQSCCEMLVGFELRKKKQVKYDGLSGYESAMVS
jgi:hypothetical protein